MFCIFRKYIYTCCYKTINARISHRWKFFVLQALNYTAILCLFLRWYYFRIFSFSFNKRNGSILLNEDEVNNATRHNRQIPWTKWRSGYPTWPWSRVIFSCWLTAKKQSVKLDKPASGQLLDQLHLPRETRGLCLLPGDRAAVTVKEKSTYR